MADKKKFKETKVGKWLKDNAPEILHTALNTADNFVPGLSFLTDLVEGEPKLTPEQKAEFKKLADETYRFELNYAKEQTSNARGMYPASKEMTDWIARRVMVHNIYYVAFLVVLNVALTFFIDSKLIALVSNIIGVVIGQLLAERQTVVQFFLGSSLGSKIKDVFKGS